MCQKQKSEGSYNSAWTKEVHSKLHSLQTSLCILYTHNVSHIPFLIDNTILRLTLLSKFYLMAGGGGFIVLFAGMGVTKSVLFGN